MKRFSSGATLWAALAAVFSSVLFSWPLPLNWLTRIPTGPQPADPLHILYGLTTGTDNLLHRPIHFFDATFFYPYTRTLAFLDQIFGLCLLAVPIQLATGQYILTYNIVWLLTFALSFLGAFLLTRSLTGSALGGLLAGVLYAFYPLRWHSAGILHVEAMMWIPFALWCLHLWEWRDRLRYFVAFLAFAALQFLSSGYGGVFLLFAALLYLCVLMGLDRIRFLGLLRNQGRRALLASAIGFLLLAPLIAPTLWNLKHGLGLHRSLGEAALWSAQVSDFLAPFPQSVLGRIAPFAEGSRHPLFPGLIALALVLPWRRRRSWRTHLRRPEMLFYVLLLVSGIVLALGPLFTIGSVRLPLPFALLFYVLPGASLIRSPVRFAILASLAIAVLAGSHLSRLLEDRKRKAVFAFVVIALAAIELYPGGLRMFDPLPNGLPPIYATIASDPRALALIELPLPVDEATETVEDGRYQLYSLHHGKRLANGIAAYVPPITRELRVEMQKFPSEDTMARLRELGINRVLLHFDRYDEAQRANLLAAVLSTAELQVLVRQENVWVLALP